MAAVIDQVRPGQLADWFARDADAPAVLLDVREPAELATAHVTPDGFTLVTMPMNDIPSRLAELDPDSRIACLCHHGTRSQAVASFLAQQGFDAVANVAGGIDAWSVEHDASVPRY